MNQKKNKIISVNDELEDLDRRERWLMMELQDVLTDIATPDSSDVEGDKIEEVAMPQVRNALLRAESQPRHWTTYQRLYDDPDYVRKANMKVRLVKNMVRRHPIASVVLTQQFATALQRIDSTYPDDGGCIGLNSLVAFYNVVNPNS